MKEKTVEEITKELESKAEKARAEIESLETAIAMDNTSIKSAEKAMTESADQNDVTAYQAAKKDRQNALDAKEMHEAHLKKLTEVPAMSESEYQEVTDAVTEETDQKMDTVRKKVLDITAELYPVQEEMAADVADANAAMKAAYDMTYPDGKRPNGALISPREYRKHFDMAAWITRAIGSKNEREVK